MTTRSRGTRTTADGSASRHIDHLTAADIRVLSVFAADVDGDGDLDVLSAS